MKTRRILIACLALVAAYSAATHANTASAARAKRTVVIVSGGMAVSPFTTPTDACKTGYAAGNTDTFLRQYLREQGYERVFTSPAMAGFGEVPATGDDMIGPFGDCPKALPQYMTVNSSGDIQLAGVSLANFVNYIGKKYGIRKVDLVAHSMGGLFSRSAIKYLRDTKSKVKVRSLTTLGTPWQGAALANPTDPNDPRSGCDGQEACINLIKVFGASAPNILLGLGRQQMDALNAYNAGVLDRIPVTLIAGNAFKKVGGSKDIWPNDGPVNVSSALAEDLPDAIIRHRTCYLFEGGTHHIYTAQNANPPLPIETAITWNSQVGNWVTRALDNADFALNQPNRQNCN